MADEEIISIGGDAAGALDALDAIIARLDDLIGITDAINSSLGVLDGMAASLDTIAAASGSASGEMDNLAASTRNAEDSASGLGGAFEGLGGIFDNLLHRGLELGGMFLEFEAIQGAISGVQHFIGNMIGMNTQFQQLTVTLKNFVGVQKAADITNWAKTYAATIPFTTESTLQAVVAITALGENAQQVVPALATVAAQMGTDMPTAVRAYTDAVNGRWVMLQNQLHITKDQLVAFGLEVDKKGHVLNNSFIPAFQKFAETKFPTALSDDMNTFGGRLSEITDLFQLFAMRIGTPLFDEFQQGLGAAMQWIGTHQDIINNLADSIGQGLADAFQTLGQMVQFAWPFLQDIFTIGQGLATGVFSVLNPLVQDASGLFHALVAPVQAVATPLGTVSSTAQSISGHLKDFSGALGNTKQQLQQVAGPLQPVVDLFKSLGGVIQEITAWFAPVPAHMEKIGGATKKWVEGADGIGHWQTTVGAALLNVPQQASGFQQFLQSLKDNFAAAFDDKNGQKIQAIAQALKDAGTALIGMGQWLVSTGLTVFQGLATVFGAIAGAVAGFFQTLQQHHLELIIFETALDAIAVILAIKMVKSLADTVIGIGKAANAFRKAALEGLHTFQNKVLDVADGLNTKLSSAADTAKGAIQKIGDTASTTADSLNNKFGPSMQSMRDTTSQVARQMTLDMAQADNQMATDMDEAEAEQQAAIERLRAEMQTATNGEMAAMQTKMEEIQVQAEATGAELSGPLVTETEAAANAMEASATGGMAAVETELQAVQVQAEATGTTLSTTLPAELETADAAMEASATGAMATTRTGLLSLQTQAETTGETLATTLPADLEAADSAMLTTGAQAEATGAQLEAMGVEAGAAGTAEAGAGIAAGGLGAALGPVGLAIGAVVAFGPQLKQTADVLQQLGDNLMNWMGITVSQSPQAIDQMKQLVKAYADAGVASSDITDAKNAVQDLLQHMEALGSISQQQMQQLQQYFDSLTTSNATTQIDQLTQAEINMGWQTPVIHQVVTDAVGDLVDLANYANDAALQWHNYDQWMAEAIMNQDKWNKMPHEAPSAYNPGGGSGGGHTGAHATGGYVGPNEMLSLINDTPGGAGELVQLPTGSYVFTHDQSVAILSEMSQLLAASPMMNGMTLSNLTSGLGGLSAPAMGGGTVEALLGQILSALQQRGPGSGPAPASASTGSLFALNGPLTLTGQQIESMESLAMALYPYMNRMSGNQTEYANLGWLG